MPYYKKSSFGPAEAMEWSTEIFFSKIRLFKIFKSFLNHRWTRQRSPPSKDTFCHFHLVAKRTVRTGWTRYGIERPESVAEHMYRMALISTLLPRTESFSVDKVMKMAIIHDLAECIVGDLTPYCGVSAEEKHAREEAAMESICEPLPADSRAELVGLLKEYDAQLTPEAIVCKDLDKFEMILQAFEYEIEAGRPGWLEEFFQSTENVFKTPCVREWVAALRETRARSTQ